MLELFLESGNENGLSFTKASVITGALVCESEGGNLVVSPAWVEAGVLTGESKGGDGTARPPWYAFMVVAVRAPVIRDDED